MAHLHEDFSAGALPAFDQLVALLSSFVAPTDWVSRNDIHKFENLLCIGNKVDLLPGHSAHIEGSNVLGDDDLSSEIKRSCLDWCIEHNIEYIEACAANADFYKCLSVDGDSQGVERLYGALSAFLWPGMILKSGDKINEPSLPDEQELSDDSDYELEYEILSAGSADPWDDRDVAWVSADGQIGTTGREGSVGYDPADEGPSVKSEIRANGGELQPSSSASLLKGNVDREEMHRTDAAIGVSESDKGTAYDFEDLEQLMFEIGNIRGSLRLMPDFQRREMAANWQ
ncbi:hypothetical protein RND71_012024 [Anisodus tanguticus]|uniref:Uncharacterized protein n=1 Tax=Anisodus tanguticus TaxID=243964 RepID=A0AAE1SEL9_9SOLA|nr:hypothetical protein RND71_012024 [Anisodus tanguticus]